MNVDVDVQSFFALSLAVHFIFYFQTKVVHGGSLSFFVVFTTVGLQMWRPEWVMLAQLISLRALHAYEAGDTAQGRLDLFVFAALEF